MLPAMDLNRTAAIISGGASGLGEAAARALAAAGSTVVIADLNADRGEAIAAELGGKFVQTDVSDEASVTAAVDVAGALGSPLRVIVNCAGIGWAERTVVINTASIAGIEGQTGQIAYSASKGGIIGMTVPAARDLSVIGVRVNT